MNLSQILPSSEELSLITLPECLKKTYMDAVTAELNPKVPVNADEKPFNLKNLKEFDDFFTIVADPNQKPPGPHKKAHVRRSLDTNSSASNSKRSSVSMSVEEFPVSLLLENEQRINELTGQIHETISAINGIGTEKENFQRLLDEYDEAVNKWTEKTELLDQKISDQPEYEVADSFLSKETKQNLQTIELLLDNLKARKALEIKLGETVPDPDSTTESMSHIKNLVAEFISRDRNGL